MSKKRFQFKNFASDQISIRFICLNARINRNVKIMIVLCTCLFVTNISFWGSRCNSEVKRSATLHFNQNRSGYWKSEFLLQEFGQEKANSSNSYLMSTYQQVSMLCSNCREAATRQEVGHEKDTSPSSYPVSTPQQASLLLSIGRGNAIMKYNRTLPTGLGDRLSVFLSVAALAKAVNSTCIVFWFRRLEPLRTRVQRTLVVKHEKGKR